MHSLHHGHQGDVRDASKQVRVGVDDCRLHAEKTRGTRPMSVTGDRDLPMAQVGGADCESQAERRGGSPAP